MAIEYDYLGPGFNYISAGSVIWIEQEQYQYERDHILRVRTRWI